MGKSLSDMTVQDCEAELERLQKARDEAKADALIVVKRRNELLAREQLAAKLSNLKTGELEALNVPDDVRGLVEKIREEKASRTDSARPPANQTLVTEPVALKASAKK